MPLSGTPIWKHSSMQSSRCANGSCPRRGRITCQALPVCLSVSYLSLLDTSSYPQIPSHVVRKSLHVEYTLFSAAHPPDFPRSPRPAWAGFRPQARVTSVHDSKPRFSIAFHCHHRRPDVHLCFLQQASVVGVPPVTSVCRTFRCI